MTVREFLNTTNVDWINLRLWVDEDAYSEDESRECEVFTDMRDISDELLNRHIDNCDVVAILTREGRVRFLLDILI